jgi:hypothetical protein
MTSSRVGQRCWQKNYRTPMARIAAILGLLVLVLLPGADARAETLTGTKAQKSPQADVLLAYEHALLSQGIDAASRYMTPERLAYMKEVLKQFGEQGFKEFQARQRQLTPEGEARRRQIEKIVVNGNTAVLNARTGPNVVDEVRLAKTVEGWKIAR